MRVLIIALLAAISYAQTAPDMSVLMPCEGRTPAQCQGHSLDGFCRMNYNKVPARCEDGDVMDSEDICASLQEDACKSKQGCCWGMRENMFVGKCVPFEMDVEDCPSMMPRMFPAMGGSTATDNTAASTDNTDATVTDNTDATVTDNTDATVTDNTDATVTDNTDATVTDNTDATADATADQTPAASSPAVSYPFMTPNPPIAQRKQALGGCETAGMMGPDACNSLMAGMHVCGWNVKEGGCEEIELGKGNLCKTVSDPDTCNQQGDCCWDMKGYCGEYDFGDCMRPMPNMGNMGGIKLPTMNINGMTIPMGMEEHMEMQQEMAENKAEMQSESMENMMEGPSELEFEELMPVAGCDNLPICHGRVGTSLKFCMLNAQGKCVEMSMPTVPFAAVPTLRKEHQSQSETSAPFNYGHLLMVLGGGLIVGLAAGMCFQNLRSKSSIAPVLLEDNYRNI